MKKVKEVIHYIRIDEEDMAMLKAMNTFTAWMIQNAEVIQE